MWVDDPHFNLAYHVRHTALPEPGDEDQLRRLTGRVFSQALDRAEAAVGDVAGRGPRRRPLRAAVQDPSRAGRRDLRRRHHDRAVRHLAGADAGGAARPRVGRRARFRAARSCSPTRSSSARPSPARSSVGCGRSFAGREQVDPARRRTRWPASARWRGPGCSRAPPSLFNVPIGPHRRFTWVRGDLDQFKAIKNALGGTVNDVVLAVVAGALGRYMRLHGEDTDGVELRAMVPVSIRADVERGRARQPGGGDVGAAARRDDRPGGAPARDQRRRCAEVKESGQAVGAQVLTALSGFAPPTIVSQAARLQARQRLFNLVVTNVPGPQMPAVPARPRARGDLSRWCRWPTTRPSGSRS